MKPNYTHITMLLDRSGSMQSIKDATEEAYNAFIADQRKIPGECTVTLHQFDDQYDTVYHALPLQMIPPLSLRPRGATALLDAMANAIDSTGQWLAATPEHLRPSNVMFVVMTDGEENFSHKYPRHAGGRESVFARVSHQRDKYNWCFVFLGANQDAIATATKLGFAASNALNFGATEREVKTCGATLSAATTNYRTSCGATASTFFDDGTIASLQNLVDLASSNREQQLNASAD